MKSLKYFINQYAFASLAVLLLTVALTASTQAQTTTFTYQGRFTDSTVAQPTNGTYQMQFALYNSGGTQIGMTIPNGSVQVTNGIFTVNLDFGAGSFTGADRFLEVRVFDTTTNAFVTLTPRQPVTSAPYAIRSLNAGTADTATTATSATNFSGNLLGDVTGAQNATVVRTVGGQSAISVGGAVQTVSAATSLNTPNTLVKRNENGDFSANTINAATQYNIGGDRVLSVNGDQHTFVGKGAGTNINLGTISDSFFGTNAGNGTTSGNYNSFFGANTGRLNNTGSENSFFGAGAGVFNTEGGNNSFFGRHAGQFNTTASNNSFFGSEAGFNNLEGSVNSFFGAAAGRANTIGEQNSFFGVSAGFSNTEGVDNSFFGRNAGRLNIDGDNNSFFGVEAGRNSAATGNSFFGRSAGLLNTSGASNAFFGFNAGSSNTTSGNNSFFGKDAGFFSTGAGNSFFGTGTGSSNSTGFNNSFFGSGAGFPNTTGNNNTIIGANARVDSFNLTYATAIGAGALVSTINTIALGRTGGADRVLIYGNAVINGSASVDGTFTVGTLLAGTATQLCITSSKTLAACSSSLRYKTNVSTFNNGLSFVNRLRPVTFDWKESKENDLGLIAEEVAEIEPLLVTRNKAGEIQGVKYDRLGVVLLNAVKEQQTQIEAQQKQIQQQQLLIDGLKKLVCSQNPQAEVCKEIQK